MSLVLQAAASYAAFSTLHASIMALSARSLGITVREVSFGFGPQLFANGLVRLRAIPLGSFVKMKDSRAEELTSDAVGDAFNHQPLWKQLSLTLSGDIALLLLALAILGGEGWAGFLSAFGQIPLGAVGPFSTAQEYLAGFESFSGENAFAAIFALVAVKMSAFNLFPVPTSNGGQALIILAKSGRPSVLWERTVARWFFWPALILLMGWTLALGSYLWRSAFF